jgi:hypothetical protein
MLGMSVCVFFGLALSGFTRGEVFAPRRFGPDSWIHKDQSPGLFWGIMLLYVGFSVVTLAVSLWRFRCIWREMSGGRHVA